MVRFPRRRNGVKLDDGGGGGGGPRFRVQTPRSSLGMVRFGLSTNHDSVLACREVNPYLDKFVYPCEKFVHQLLLQNFALFLNTVLVCFSLNGNLAPITL